MSRNGNHPGDNGASAANYVLTARLGEHGLPSPIRVRFDRENGFGDSDPAKVARAIFGECVAQGNWGPIPGGFSLCLRSRSGLDPKSFEAALRTLEGMGLLRDRRGEPGSCIQLTTGFARACEEAQLPSVTVSSI